MREVKCDLALDPGTRGDRSGGWNPLHDRSRGPGCLGATCQYRALRDSIDLAISGVQWRHDQRTAKQAFGITDRSDVDVDLRSCASKWRQRRSYDHGCDVLGAKGFIGHVHTQSFQKAGHDLFGEGRVAQTVSRAVEADDKAVADKVVSTHTVDIRKILDANRCSGRPACAAEQQNRDVKQPHHR